MVWAVAITHLLPATKKRVLCNTHLIQRRGRRQNIGDHAVPAHHIGGIHVDDVARLQGEAVGQQHGVRRAAVQVEEFGLVGVTPHHVDPLGVGAFLGNVASIGQGFGQRGALFRHDHGAGLGDFAQHKDLVEAAVLHVEDVTRLEERVLIGGAGFVHGLDVYPVGGTLAGEQHAAVVSLGREAPCPVHRLKHRHGDVVHFQQAGLGHFTYHVHALAAEGRHAHVELHFFDELGEPAGQQVAHLAGGFAGHLQRTHVGVVDGAVFGYHGAGLVGRPVLAGRGGELGVVPHDDAEDVARADLVVRRAEAVFGATAAVGGEVVVCSGGPRGRGRLELFDDQFGSNGLDGHVGRRGFTGVGLAYRQFD